MYIELIFVALLSCICVYDYFEQTNTRAIKLSICGYHYIKQYLFFVHWEEGGGRREVEEQWSSWQDLIYFRRENGISKLV